VKKQLADFLMGLRWSKRLSLNAPICKEIVHRGLKRRFFVKNLICRGLTQGYGSMYPDTCIVSPNYDLLILPLSSKPNLTTRLRVLYRVV
jgi:hypothetical protein